MHYTMGGMWVDFDQATNVPGIFAAGECEYSAITAPIVWGRIRWCPASLAGSSRAECSSLRTLPGRRRPADGHFEAEQKRQEAINVGLMSSNGVENPFRLWRELGELMTKDCTVIRHNKNLVETDA